MRTRIFFSDSPVNLPFRWCHIRGIFFYLDARAHLFSDARTSFFPDTWANSMAKIWQIMMKLQMALINITQIRSALKHGIMQLRHYWFSKENSDMRFSVCAGFRVGLTFALVERDVYTVCFIHFRHLILSFFWKHRLRTVPPCRRTVRDHSQSSLSDWKFRLINIPLPCDMTDIWQSHIEFHTI